MSVNSESDPHQDKSAHSCEHQQPCRHVMERKLSHCHEEEDPVDIAAKRKEAKAARQKLINAAILCFVFMIAEIIGGVISNSLAVMTDALHLVTDLFGYAISITAITLSQRKTTQKMTFGYKRAEVVGALISILLIWVITAVLVFMAVLRIIQETYEVEAPIMLITSSLGVGINLTMGIQLEYTGDDEDEDDNNVGPEKQLNMNVKAAIIHILGDLGQSVGVMVAALVIFFEPEYKIADPICTFVFAFFVVMTTFTMIRDIFHVLMEGAPGGVQYAKVHDDLLAIAGVEMIHNLRLWTLNAANTACSAHICVKPITNYEQHTEILEACRKMLRQKHGITDITLQMEQHTESVPICPKCHAVSSL